MLLLVSIGALNVKITTFDSFILHDIIISSIFIVGFVVVMRSYGCAVAYVGLCVSSTCVPSAGLWAVLDNRSQRCVSASLLLAPSPHLVVWHLTMKTDMICGSGVLYQVRPRGDSSVNITRGLRLYN